MRERNRTDALRRRMADARARLRPVHIVGASSRFRFPDGDAVVMSMVGHTGVLTHSPSELYVTVRAGTPVTELRDALRPAGQWLACDPGAPAPGSTIGGAVATGSAGPSRPWCGSIRDALLGVTVLTGDADIVTFGGRVMKNVAGYDVSRLMAGAWGCLGVLLDVTLKVLPRPPAARTLVAEMDAADAIELWNQQRRRPLPISGAFHVYGHLYTRIVGDEATIEKTAAALGGETTEDSVWDELRDMRHPFFAMPGPLWRVSLPPASPPLGLEGHVLIDWAGAQRWVITPEPAGKVIATASGAGGYAVRWSRSQDGSVRAAAPMADPARVKVIRELRKSFDSGGILNARILPATAPAGAPVL